MASDLSARAMRPSGPAAKLAAAIPQKRRRLRRNVSGIPTTLEPHHTKQSTRNLLDDGIDDDHSDEASPCRARGRSLRQENPAHDHDPHNADQRPHEPRIDAIRPPDTAQPRRAAGHTEDDGADARAEERV